MIPLTRARSVAKIHPYFLGEKRKAKLLDLYRKRLTLGKDIPSKEFDSAYWKESKGQLIVESAEKCAYCECSVPQVAHGDVEHFRPKSKYWWLAYCYENYLFSCQICNQIYKGDEFPVGAQALKEPQVNPALDEAAIMKLFDKVSPAPNAGATSLANFQKYLNKEKAPLPNPYYQNPEKYFIWEEDEINRTVAMKPNPKTKNATAVFNAVDKYYGINRVELTRLRYTYLRHFKIYKKAIANNIDKELVKESKAMIVEMVAANHPFAGMLRYYDKQL